MWYVKQLMKGNFVNTLRIIPHYNLFLLSFLFWFAMKRWIQLLQWKKPVFLISSISLPRVNTASFITQVFNTDSMQTSSIYCSDCLWQMLRLLLVKYLFFSLPLDRCCFPHSNSGFCCRGMSKCKQTKQFLMQFFLLFHFFSLFLFLFFFSQILANVLDDMWVCHFTLFAS